MGRIDDDVLRNQESITMKIAALTFTAVLTASPAFAQNFWTARYRYEEFRYPDARDTYLYSINDQV